MKAIIVLGAALTLGFGATAHAEDQPVAPKIPPAEMTVKIKVPEGINDQDIAAAIAAENAKREPAAQEAARVAKQKAARDEEHAERIGKICDSIPEKALADDASLRRMCQ